MPARPATGHAPAPVPAPAAIAGASRVKGQRALGQLASRWSLAARKLELAAMPRPPMPYVSAHTAQFEPVRPSALARISGGLGWKADIRTRLLRDYPSGRSPRRACRIAKLNASIYLPDPKFLRRCNGGPPTARQTRQSECVIV